MRVFYGTLAADEAQAEASCIVQDEAEHAVRAEWQRDTSSEVAGSAKANTAGRGAPRRPELHVQLFGGCSQRQHRALAVSTF